MTARTLEDAKNRLSGFVPQILSDGAQDFTVRGESVMAIATGELRTLRRQPESWAAFLRASPLRELDLSSRVRDIGRELDL